MILLSTPLVSAVELSSLFSILTVFLSFVVMVIFILSLRLREEDLMATSVQFVTPIVYQTDLVKVRIPFTLNVVDIKHSSVRNCSVTVRSEVECSVAALWGVPVTNFHSCLTGTWPELREHLINQSLLRENRQGFFHSNLDISMVKTDVVLNIELPHDQVLELGAPPRQYYPLVVIVYTLQAGDVVAMFTVIHFSDTECHLPSCILAQYLKQSSGQVTCMRQLYTSTDSPVEDGGEYTNTSFHNDNISQLCVVCQTLPVSRALLPCRHTILCATCFRKLNRCPMCRSPIQSFFLEGLVGTMD